MTKGSDLFLKAVFGHVAKLIKLYMNPSFTSYSEPVMGSHDTGAGLKMHKTDKTAIAVHIIENGMVLHLLSVTAIGGDL
jgi:hypothetical protein